jgi:hypothetical protein
LFFFERFSDLFYFFIASFQIDSVGGNQIPQFLSDLIRKLKQKESSVATLGVPRVEQLVLASAPRARRDRWRPAREQLVPPRSDPRNQIRSEIKKKTQGIDPAPGPGAGLPPRE